MKININNLNGLNCTNREIALISQLCVSKNAPAYYTQNTNTAQKSLKLTLN